MNHFQKNTYYIFILMILIFALIPINAQSMWNEAAPPQIISVSTADNDPGTVRIVFSMPTHQQAADKGRVVMLKDGEVVFEKPVGKSKADEKKTDFTPSESGLYSFIVYAQKKNEALEHRSEPVDFYFTLPLSKPDFQVRNTGSGEVYISWNEVKEAQSYTVRLIDEQGSVSVHPDISNTDKTVSGLKIGSKYSIQVEAVRNEEVSVSDSIGKTIRAEPEREWFFTYFGQSVKKEFNTFEMLDADNFTFKMSSCLFDDKTGTTLEKGGKFTAFHDGVSFYYTVIDAEEENFTLTATFTIDYINPTADGQEGFGLLVMDSLGEYGVSSVNHYTNSAGIIATKFEETIAGTKYTSKDTLGSRFVTGLTKDTIALGDSGIAQYGKSLSRAFSYDQSSLVKKGDVYRLTLKKDNTGYHTIYEKEIVNEEDIREFTLYGPEKLLELDSEHVYAGFACARGCNITVSDVVMTVTNPDTDPPPQKEPAQLLPLSAKVDSPSSYTEPLYPFIYSSNADGLLVVSTSNGEKVFEKRVTANEDVKEYLILRKGVNSYSAVFTPDPNYKPFENTVIARWDSELKKYDENYSSISTNFTVIYMSFTGEDGKLYVSKKGNVFGKGTKDSPLDLLSAIQYCKPGQTIVLEGGTYTFSKGLVIERGNNGSIMQRKTMQSSDGERAVLDFSYAGGGFVLWGNYWTIENIDICNTDGNVKGLQVAGNRNIIRRVNTYSNGDTGLQISGTSTEPYSKWPKNNLIESCVSYNNCDPAQNNADGFAAKLTCGEGNVFRNCIAYSNIDDGWDLFSKIETGPIGSVLIDRCAAFNNGSLLDGSGNGDGNGFKLGGDGISIKHRIINSYAWNNGAAGLTSNSNPSVIADGCVLYGNKGVNITMYGKGSVEPDYSVKNCISVEGFESDSLPSSLLAVVKNSFIWDGAQSRHKNGSIFSKDDFLSTDMSIIPSIADNGSIDMRGLFKIE